MEIEKNLTILRAEKVFSQSDVWPRTFQHPLLKVVKKEQWIVEEFSSKTTVFQQQEFVKYCLFKNHVMW